MSRSSACARAVVAVLLARGVTDVVLAPGSRSAPLALALYAEAAAGRLRLHVRVDERTAGFLALGLAKGSGRPVPVVTTSGTAVGNLLPAVMEAHHARVPLLPVTADRPAGMVGTGANQTTHQPGIFGVFVRDQQDVDAAAEPASWVAGAAAAITAAEGRASGYPGPAHLNLALPEPLVPDDAVSIESVGTTAARGGSPASGARSADVAGTDSPVPGLDKLDRRGEECVELPAGPRTVVVCGDASPSEGATARAFAEAAELPLLAEPSSGARGGPNALRCGRLLLGTALGERVERVVMFGHPTLSRPVTGLLTRPAVELVVVGTGPGLPNPGWNAARTVAAVTPAPGAADAGWLAEWLAADRACGDRVDALLAGLDHTSGPAVAATVLAGVDAGALALGNSMAIRDADLAPVAARSRPVHANRGLSGIDGTLSTAAGIALATGEPVTLLCGDLSFVHDVNALAIGPGEPRPDLRVVVADDSGGAIFATLEYGQPRFAAGFERVFATPTGLDPVALAAGYGVPARRLPGLDELAAALAEPVRGIEVLVIGVDRHDRAGLAAALAACAHPAVPQRPARPEGGTTRG